MKAALLALSLVFVIPAFVPAAAHAETATQKRASIQKMETETLTRLYNSRPDTRREIADATGYAVFSNGSLALLWVSGGYGHGIAHNNKTGRSTYMQMASAGVGLGLGAKDYQTVFVFHTPQAYDAFIHSGLDMSGHADAAAKVGVKGKAYTGAADVIPGVRVYQMTDNGLMAQAMLQGTKYWPDRALNAAFAPPTPTQNTTQNPTQNMNQQIEPDGFRPVPVTRTKLNN